MTLPENFSPGRQQFYFKNNEPQWADARTQLLASLQPTLTLTDPFSIGIL